jgi:hypothetical protein
LRDGKDLGASPILVEVKEGETVKLEFRAKGYKPLGLTVDGAKPSLNAKLVRISQAPSVAVAESQPAVKPAKRKGDAETIVDPWGGSR